MGEGYWVGGAVEFDQVIVIETHAMPGTSAK